MVNGFFTKRKPQTRLSKSAELNKIATFLDCLENKEKELAADATKYGAGSTDYRKHTVVKLLLDELNKDVTEFNKVKQPQNEDKNKQDMIKLVQAMYQTIEKTLGLFTNTLMTPRKQYEFLKTFLDYSSYSFALFAAVYLPLGVLGTLFSLFYLAPKASSKTRSLLGLDNEITATMILLKAFAKELIAAGENLGLAKHWQLKHGNPNDLEFEDDILCPINRTIMKEPTFCTLDERTYEDEAIRKWLTLHGTSPFNPSAKLAPGQNVNTVLKLNRNLKNVIEVLQKNHPEYGDAERELPRMKVG